MGPPTALRISTSGAFDGKIPASLPCSTPSLFSQTIPSAIAATLGYCQPSCVLLRVAGKRLQIRSAMQDQSSENQLSSQELFVTFLRERQARSDFISKAADSLWRREIFDVDEEKLFEVRERIAELQKIREEESDNGFLKLIQARRWSLGLDRAPTNAKPDANEAERLQEDRRRAGFLEYEALKRELSLMTVAIALLCGIYCVVVLSLEACLSYGIGAVGSTLYLKLLYRHVDQISEDNIAEVFLRRRRKKIGIRSIDVQEFFEKIIFGSSLALSSPRLVVPASLFGLWTIVHQSSTDIHFNLQLAPLMLGFFAHKAALLVQAYRDNKDLVMTFPKEVMKSWDN